MKEKNPFVAIEKGQIVGFSELESDGHIDMFYCDAEWQGKGIGTLLLLAMEEEAKRRDIRRLFAESSSVAIHFFRAKGFKVVEERNSIICGAPAKQFIIEKEL